MFAFNVLASLFIMVPAVPAAASNEMLNEVFRYDFNDGKLAPVIDVTGQKHHGTVKPDTTVLQLVPGENGRLAVQFPSTGSALIEVGGAAVPAAGARTFRFGARIRFGSAPVAGKHTVIQQGFPSASDQWKLDVDDGVASCVVKIDGGAEVRVQAGTIVDTAWHDVECRKTGTTLAVYIGNVLKGSKPVPGGLVDQLGSGRPTLGGIPNSAADQYRGSLDAVFFAVDKETTPDPAGDLRATPAVSNTSWADVVATTTPTLTAKAVDPHGRPLKHSFVVMPKGGSDVVASGDVPDVPSGGTSSWTVPAGVLENAKSYDFKVKVSTGSDVSLWSVRRKFTTDAANVPTDLATGLEEPTSPVLSGVVSRVSTRSMTARFYLFDIDGKPVGASPLGVATAEGGRRVSLRVPEGLVEQGGAYRWQMESCADGGACSARSGAIDFTVPRQPESPAERTATLDRQTITFRVAHSAPDACGGAACQLAVTNDAQLGGGGASRKLTLVTIDPASIPAGAQITSATVNMGSAHCAAGCPADAKLKLHALKQQLPENATGADVVQRLVEEPEAEYGFGDAALDVTSFVQDWHATPADSEFRDPGLVLIADDGVPAASLGEDATVQIRYVAPTAPGTITRIDTRPGDGGVLLNWSQPDDVGAAVPVDGYDLQVIGADGGVVRTVDSEGQRVVVGELTNGTAYRFRVRARTTFGSGPWVTSEVTTPAAVPGGPGQYLDAVRAYVQARAGIADGQYTTADDALAESPQGETVNAVLSTVADDIPPPAQENSQTTRNIRLSDTLVSVTSAGKITVRATVSADLVYPAQDADTPTGGDWEETTDYVFEQRTPAASLHLRAQAAQTSGYEMTRQLGGDYVDAKVEPSSFELNGLTDGEEIPEPPVSTVSAARTPRAGVVSQSAVNTGGMVRWAHKHAYDRWEYGQDCTNFVSRVLNHGGGLRMFGKWDGWKHRKNNRLWYERFDHDSYSWAAVRHNFDHFYSKRRRATEVRLYGTWPEVRVGDIIYWFNHHKKSAGQDPWRHAAVVTKKGSPNVAWGGVFITQHGHTKGRDIPLKRPDSGVQYIILRPHW
ncbi:amidase domain-containing protein [Streptosporangium sp. NPDC020145]|uniref:amidase domain-containing protein n=1 Tax=Streptosporangium sp. NPDC020145 TaxID=3154694 RepID=UPI00342CD73D